MSDRLQDAQRLYTESMEALSEQRKQIEEDLSFSDPSDPAQWDEDIKRRRENDPGGKRPCLVHDQLGQYTAQVTGQIEKQPPSLHAIPVSGGADKKAAEQIDGRFRHIEHASRATQHYARALTSAGRTGVGYLTIRPEYVDRALGWQEPRIGSEPDPLKVVFDPWSVETDGSDADFGFVLTQISQREFERRWPKKDIKDFGDTAASSKREESKSILVAEYWHKEYKSRTQVIYTDEQGQEASVTADEFMDINAQAGGLLVPVREYKDKSMSVKWCRMSGADVLEESDYPAEFIGVVPVYGYVGFADGRMTYCGIPRRGRAPQQAYNYHISEQLAHIGTAPRSPWLVSKRAAAGVEELWDNASREARGWLPFNDMDEQGPINQPNRINTGTNLVNHEAGAAAALRDIQAAIGMYQANLGAPSNETSGVAIESRKEQGESSTAHFPSHMAASLGHVGNIVMQMDAKLTDARRTQPILGVDGAPGQITVDPEQKQAFQRLPNNGGVSVNPNVGRYGVRVVVGASYSTQRTQTNAAFAEIMRGNKELAATVAPFWAQTLDFPGSDKFAQAMAAMAPPPVKALLQPEGGEDEMDPAAMAQRLAELQAALQEAIQHAEEAQGEADQAMREADVQKTKAMARDKELEIAEYEAETKRLQVTGANEQQIQAITGELVGEMLTGAMPKISEAAGMAGQQGAVSAMQAAQAAQPDTSEDDAAMLQAMQALMQGQQQLDARILQLMGLVSRSRERIPVRNAAGDIERVIDRMTDEPGMQGRGPDGQPVGVQ